MRIPFCKKNDLEVISLLNKNTNWVARLNKLGIFLFFSILVVNIFAFSSWESNLVLLVPSLSLAIATGGFFIFKRFKMKLKNKFYYRDLLISFILDNILIYIYFTPILCIKIINKFKILIISNLNNSVLIF